MDREIINYEKVQKATLSKDMPRKNITIAEDETFHGGTCLVAVECKSNFILLEKYMKDRTCNTWNIFLDTALKGLNVHVLQVVSDEAGALKKHAVVCLGAHHSSDVFHVTYEIGKGTSYPLATKVRSAEKEYAKCIAKTEKLEKKQDKSLLEKDKVGCPVNYGQEIKQSKHEEKNAKEALSSSQERQKTVMDEKALIGKKYHPYDLETGKLQSSEDIKVLLNNCFENIYEASSQLSEKCIKRIDKAKKLVSKLVATISFFMLMVDEILEKSVLSDEQKAFVRDKLIPGVYLETAGRKVRDVDRRLIILEKSRELLNSLNDCSYTKSDQEEMLNIATECAHIFQRSSSCVEGRNAQLALRYRSIHRMTNTQLKIQTTIHNYFLKRKDGSTAASRFFNKKHDDLFTWLVDNLEYPSRPRKRLCKAA